MSQVPYKNRIRLLFSILGFLAFSGLEGIAIWSEGFSLLYLFIHIGLFALFLLFMLVPLPKFLSHYPYFSVLIDLAAPVGLFYLMESFTHIVWDTMEWDAILLNLIFYYLLYLALILIFGQVKRALMLETFLVLFVGIANYFVILFRSTPILPWDLLSFKTAISVADNYTFSVTHLVANLIGGFLVMSALISQTYAFRLSAITNYLPRRWFGGLIRLVLLCLLMIPGTFYINYLFQPDLADHTSLDDTLFTPKVMFRKNGFFVAFLMDMRFLQIDPPAGYSKSAAQTLLDTYQDDSTTTLPDELPNVIVIMNEAFSDPSVLGEFDTNIDYMPTVSALLDGAENTISGHLYVSVLGGNTANSEYEFLTGNTMAFLPNGSVPYQQYIRSDVVSIVDQFNALGYKTVGMHPYNASGWNRNKVYSWMHFDTSLFYNDFKDRTKLRKYISDECDYQNILSILEETQEPLFVFNVTMQNHSGYGDAYDNFTPEVSATLSNTKSNKYLDNYLSLLKISDDALCNLLDTLKTDDRPTIVVFFGDHQPNDYVVKPIYKENGLDIDNQTLEQQQKRQIVPFFIWANYDIEEKSNVTTSINYLSSLLFDAAKLPKSSYQNFLTALSEQIPAINPISYLTPALDPIILENADGTVKEWIEQYKSLQYYNMFDAK